MFRLLAATGLVVSSLAAAQIPAQAQTPVKDWPQRNVTLILPLGPGSGVDISLVTPIPTEWWLRPVISACRVGEHSGVTWNRL